MNKDRIWKIIQEWVCHLNEYTTANKHGDYTWSVLSNSSFFLLVCDIRTSQGSKGKLLIINDNCMGFKGISWSISGDIFRVIACTNVCFVHCSYLSKCRYCRRTFDFLKEISLPLLCSTMQWEFTLSSQIEILSWERNGSLKIRGHEGSDFKLFQELCLTRIKVETFKILRLFGVKKKKPW